MTMSVFFLYSSQGIYSAARRSAGVRFCCRLSAKQSWRIFHRPSVWQSSFTIGSKTGPCSASCYGSLVLFCISCVCASLDKRFCDLQVACEMNFDGPVFHKSVATTRAEIFTKSRLSPETLHFIATLLKRIEKTAATTLLNDFS